ncbi:DUF5064 family protein [uncultured Pseudomonas sp.]|uniref:DUF5064 family protein n=1 Tax=uncultured Pseudomonas sp. TaxID=114707 RepID=UPI002624CB30|nr:DUF5064 family protein [uncultured Pseudomonas sp.]
MFEPGHLHRANTLATAELPLFNIDLYYEVRQDSSEGPMLHMRLQGQVDGKVFEEVFELHRDTAYNFASVVSRLAHKHGMPTDSSLIMHSHAEYDQMFEDIRAKLGAHSGEPVNLDHLDKDGF